MQSSVVPMSVSIGSARKMPMNTSATPDTRPSRMAVCTTSSTSFHAFMP